MTCVSLTWNMELCHTIFVSFILLSPPFYFCFFFSMCTFFFWYSVRLRFLSSGHWLSACFTFHSRANVIAITLTAPVDLA